VPSLILFVADLGAARALYVDALALPILFEDEIIVVNLLDQSWLPYPSFERATTLERSPLELRQLPEYRSYALAPFLAQGAKVGIALRETPAFLHG
jgi:hypothetical protein